MSCGHTFAYWSVIPPTHCYVCGASLNAGSTPSTRYATITTTANTTKISPAGSPSKRSREAASQQTRASG